MCSKEATDENQCICEIQNLFTPLHVHKIMAASHALYQDYFSREGQQLMIQDLYPWIPPKAFSMLEAGGLIISQEDSSNNDDFLKSANKYIVSHKKNTLEKDDVLILPLISLLHGFSTFSKTNQDKTSIVVTAKGHTTCYMCSEKGNIFYFDPLPAILTLIPLDQIRDTIMDHFGVNVEYSAIIVSNS